MLLEVGDVPVIEMVEDVLDEVPEPVTGMEYPAVTVVPFAHRPVVIGCVPAFAVLAVLVIE
jgi:hypothetical protein